MAQMNLILVSSVRREVIEDQLLVTLEDKSKVAIIATETDLDMLISGLQSIVTDTGDGPKRDAYLADLRTLRKQAFGK